MVQDGVRDGVEDGVRRAAPGDWEAVRDLRLRALSDAPEAFASTLAREQALPAEEWRRRTRDGNWFVAGVGGRPVGLAAAFTDLEMPDERHLVSMWVAPTARGGPTATTVVEAVCDWAAADGARAVTLWVVDDNVRARRFYERTGFVPTGARQSLPRDAAVMEHQLRRRLGDVDRPGAGPRRGGP